MRMKTLRIAAIAISLAAAETALAGGLLTNTNQNIVFLRNPARDAAIGIDGVYSNPAGVAFLGDGLHLSINLQNAHQTRTVTTGFPLFVFNADKPGQTVRKFKGDADAPIVPSIQAAWNKGKWSLQFGFAITGGGGKCEFDGGLGSFEQVVASLPAAAQALNAAFAGIGQLDSSSPFAKEQIGNGYSFDSYMRGRQYYYGFTLGAARKLTDNLSVYGGLRMLYGTANYYGYVRDIKVESAIHGMANAPKHFGEAQLELAKYSGIAATKAEQAQAASNAAAAAATQARAAATGLAAGAAGANQLAGLTQDIELNCDQTGWGIAPIIGVDYKTGRLNLAAKYEFKTRMRLKNKSANSESAKSIPMLEKYADGNKVAEDSPALLTVGAQYEITNDLRVMAGWHHYFDVDTKQYTKDMLSDSNEYLFGAEYDICDILQVSAGAQRTAYSLKDAGINDISFNVSSWSYGFGVGVKVSEKVKINAAYFQTLYDDYNKTEAIVTNSFTRTNRVLGLGVDLKL